MKSNSKFIIVLLISFLASCVSQLPLSDNDSLVREAIESSAALEKADLPLSKIPSETLYDLLVGDVALSRSQFDTALIKYARQARVTEDKEVIQLALRIAEHLKDQTIRLEMSLLWLNMAPDDPQARRAALDLSLIHIRRCRRAI